MFVIETRTDLNLREKLRDSRCTKFVEGKDDGRSAYLDSNEFRHELRACLRCRLVKKYDQFRDSGCGNCPFFKMEDDHERIVHVTTPNFNGIISVMDPRRSWAARWLRIGKFAPGCYTVAFSEALPEEMQVKINTSTPLLLKTLEETPRSPSFNKDMAL